MPDHIDMPPVLQSLGDDLLVAMKAAGARQARTPRVWTPAVVAGWTTKRWATATSAAVALGAVIAALVLATTGGGPQNAFADWSSTPSPPTSAQLQAAEAACEQQSPDLGSLTPTISDFRGQNALLLYAGSTTATLCDTGSSLFGTRVSVWPADSSPVAAGAIDPETSTLTAARTGQLFLTLTGRVGDAVTAVTLVLRDDNTVAATVAGGWFAAWWPESSSGGQPGQGGPIGHAVAQSMQITTASGTTTQPLDMPNGPGPASINGEPMGPCTQTPAACGASGVTGTLSTPATTARAERPGRTLTKPAH